MVVDALADAPSRRPRSNARSIAYHHDLTRMIEKYAQDSDFMEIIQDLESNVLREPFSLKEGFLLHG